VRRLSCLERTAILYVVLSVFAGIVAFVTSWSGPLITEIISGLICVWAIVILLRILKSLREIRKLRKEHQAYLAGVMQDQILWESVKKDGRMH
jgi:L-lactate permease